MSPDYTKIENDFDCACQDVIKNLSEKYRADYKAAGPGKLETFFKLIQEEFKHIEAFFIQDNKLESDQEAIRRVKTIAKSYAKKCLFDYGKVKE
ncbi:hypothetical protein [Flavobacterium rhizosphaerae]|uniref:Uncharacterized protein n=1 Tax=Flavobacterium rhizosphaerae TaxID=3163298 RepID=A0ABW8YTZ6_9FLAO